MSDVLIDQNTMEDIGDSIRSKLGVQTTYLPSEMPNAIMSISGGGNEMELTKAEYDALSEAEKTNGTTYYITDAQSWTSKEVQPVIYSTDEREIGVWTDGKPLYAKTVSFTITVGNGYTTYTHNIANITPIAVEGEVHSATDDLIFTKGANAAANLGFGFNTTTVYFYQNSSYFNNYKARATLYYTKTTDQAGSGIYTPQGQLAVHYSTDEHVIGTWIDGKTLYEKTVIIDMTNTTIYDGTTFSTGITGADYITIVEQTFWDGRENTGSGYYASIPMFYLQSTNGMDLNFCVPMDDKTKIRAIIKKQGTEAYANANRKIYITLRYTKITS